MFKALFILTTIDAGTRIARSLVQEFLGTIWAPLGDLKWWPAALLSTGLVVLGWGYFIYTGSVETIWPMFGMANQLLAVIALAVVTTILFNAGRGRYARVTILPMLFVATTTSTTAYHEIGRYWSKMVQAGQPLQGWLNIGTTAMLFMRGGPGDRGSAICSGTTGGPGHEPRHNSTRPGSRRPRIRSRLAKKPCYEARVGG